jgi:hypothetical protein
MPQRKSKSKRVRPAARRANKSSSRSARAPTKNVGPSVAFSLQQTLPVFPASRLVTQQLYYDSGFSLTGTAGVLARYVFSANGAYDPDITGTGHQMMGFDQMMLFYEQAVVVRSKIKVTFFSAAQTAIRCAISLTPDASAAASVNDLMENGYCVSTIILGLGGLAAEHATKTLELTCDVPKYFGRSRASLISSPEFYCTAAANPTEQVYFQVQTWNPTGVVTTITSFDVTLSFDIFYYEPRKVGGSFWHEAVDAIKKHRELTVPSDGGGLAKTCGAALESKQPDKSGGWFK